MIRMTQFKTASPMLGVFKKEKPIALPTNEFVLVLDQISDPGNLGTILRQASWFGIQHVLCSEQPVDCYNSKVAGFDGRNGKSLLLWKLGGFLQVQLPVFVLAFG